MASTQTVCPKCGKDVDFDSALVRCYCPGCGRMLISADLSEKPSAEEACALLRKKRSLYVLAAFYGAAEAEDIAGGEVYSRAENCHAPLTLLLPEAACPEEAQRKVYGSVVSERQRQAYRTIPWEAVRDGELVDGVLSGGPCAVTLDSQGALAGTEESAFTLGLPALLKRNFPRSTVKK